MTNATSHARLDHLVFGATSLDAGTTAFERRAGVVLRPTACTRVVSPAT